MVADTPSPVRSDSPSWRLCEYEVSSSANAGAHRTARRHSAIEAGPGVIARRRIAATLSRCYLPGMLSRRGLLASLVATLALPRLARAIGPGSKFKFGQLQLGAGWNPRPTALKRMAWELSKRTSIDVDGDAAVVTPTSETLHETPFLYLAGDRAMDLPTGPAIEALRRFLTFGGFLL